ncbi:hypothetical protein MYSE111917_10210 [Mycobacterium senriense]|uniref:Uncharacterized protein n=1 Tax=Mycobacterium senriense TaxID=2775496 RepID=A0ABN6IID5_9MYCO|nr:hypothetical protein [Mycobacterium senriense]BCZ22980.1 hypothetical protein MTY59_28350 [Mycobacterium senriense]
MVDPSALAAARIIEHSASYLKCGHCQRVATKANAVIRRLPGIDVVLCHDCQFERLTSALLLAHTEVEEGDATAVA